MEQLNTVEYDVLQAAFLDTKVNFSMGGFELISENACRTSLTPPVYSLDEKQHTVQVI